MGVKSRILVAATVFLMCHCSLSGMQVTIQEMATETDTFIRAWSSNCSSCEFLSLAKSLATLVEKIRKDAREMALAPITKYNEVYWGGLHADIDPTLGTAISSLLEAFLNEVPSGDITILKSLRSKERVLILEVHRFPATILTTMVNANKSYNQGMDLLDTDITPNAVITPTFFNMSERLEHNFVLFESLVHSEYQSVRDMPLECSRRVKEAALVMQYLCDANPEYPHCKGAVDIFIRAADRFLQTAELFL